ncbi:hypothetical protein EUGRSUZ_I02292 [Eucalyptus grandis]|uniref:Uncharacterized protein n=2 Tax=Eucalyptus grandis TaxID=71139 RepID=A0ACC3JJ77_EUCGR|nr:hypothetical protein EUGRSUZ_I02292 [Eucalyptus grandis]
MTNKTEYVIKTYCLFLMKQRSVLGKETQIKLKKYRRILGTRKANQLQEDCSVSLPCILKHAIHTICSSKETR